MPRGAPPTCPGFFAEEVLTGRRGVSRMRRRGQSRIRSRAPGRPEQEEGHRVGTRRFAPSYPASREEGRGIAVDTPHPSVVAQRVAGQSPVLLFDPGRRARGVRRTDLHLDARVGRADLHGGNRRVHSPGARGVRSRSGLCRGQCLADPALDRGRCIAVRAPGVHSGTRGGRAWNGCRHRLVSLPGLPRSADRAPHQGGCLVHHHRIGWRRGPRGPGRTDQFGCGGGPVRRAPGSPRGAADPSSCRDGRRAIRDLSRPSGYGDLCQRDPVLRARVSSTKLFPSRWSRRLSRTR